MQTVTTIGLDIASDAEAICEALTRANMRFVETKTPEHQSCLMLHRTRYQFIRQQTAVINAIRAHLTEFGIVARVTQSSLRSFYWREGGSTLSPKARNVGLRQRKYLLTCGALFDLDPVRRSPER